MDIRLLQEYEVQMAVYTAQQIFEMCVRPYVRSQQEVDWFYGYVQVENLHREMREGRLILWGAFDGGRMCAVSAMQTVGHITMLYVRPECTGRKTGTKLLNYMCAYAQGILHKDRVTVNVMPTAAAPYFYKRGFAMMQEVPRVDEYLSLERQTAWKPQEKELVTYQQKYVSPLVIVALTAGVLLFSFVVIVGVTVFS